MKILKLLLLVSFVNVEAISQSHGEGNKKLANQISDLPAPSSVVAKEKFNDSNPNSISDTLNDSSINKNTYFHLKDNPKGAESKTADRDYLTEIKDSLNKIFDLCSIVGGIGLIFITLKILYSLCRYIDSLTIRFEKRKPANLKQKDE